MLLTRYTLIAIFSAYILAIVKKCAQKTYMYTQTHTHTHTQLQYTICTHAQRHTKCRGILSREYEMGINTSCSV